MVSPCVRFLSVVHSTNRSRGSRGFSSYNWRCMYVWHVGSPEHESHAKRGHPSSDQNDGRRLRRRGAANRPLLELGVRQPHVFLPGVRKQGIRFDGWCVVHISIWLARQRHSLVTSVLRVLCCMEHSVVFVLLSTVVVFLVSG